MKNSQAQRGGTSGEAGGRRDAKPASPPYSNRPAWLTAECEPALAQCLANPPSTYVRSGDDWQGPSERFTCAGENGKPLAVLRKAYRTWFESEFLTLDAIYAATHRWDDDAAKALHRTEDADALVKRLLAEHERAAA